uniref:Uncharacterized protein n=1 Tax=Rhizophagus irregularis (strain DAOM 181602 / DAOM 197198 / MUCL 43194) TaxID=747089 RepID=U9SPK4_RHIID
MMMISITSMHRISEDALDKESVEYQTLRNGAKKVLGVVVGLLKDRACAEDDPPQRKRLE